MSDTKHSEQAARATLAGVREMVAALGVDWDRLTELREERDGFTFDEDANLAPDGPGYLNDAEAWAGENPEDAEELAALDKARGEDEDEEDARRRIEEDPLSIEVRSPWTTVREELSAEDGEYCILLCTGGPAVRIVGELRGFEPHTARIEHQDWFTPWTPLQTTSEEEADLVTYAGQFRYGD
jgi:hypothetical protein